jgi:hypothetical protein
VLEPHSFVGVRASPPTYKEVVVEDIVGGNPSPPNMKVKVGKIR